MVKVEFEWWVTITGDNYDSEYEEWLGDGRLVAERCFGRYEDALAFVRDMTPEQALYWEDRAGTNGLCLSIYREEVIAGHYNDFTGLGNADWIGGKYNGDDFWDYKED